MEKSLSQQWVKKNNPFRINSKTTQNGVQNRFRLVPVYIIKKKRTLSPFTLCVPQGRKNSTVNFDLSEKQLHSPDVRRLFQKSCFHLLGQKKRKSKRFLCTKVDCLKRWSKQQIRHQTLENNLCVLTWKWTMKNVQEHSEEAKHFVKCTQFY